MRIFLAAMGSKTVEFSLLGWPEAGVQYQPAITESTPPANYYGTKNRGWEDDSLLKGLIFSFHFCPFKVEIRFFFHLRHKPSTCPRVALYFRCLHVLVQAPKKCQAYVTTTLNPTVGNLRFLKVRDGTLKSPKEGSAGP